LDASESVTFSLAGTTIEPVNLEFGQEMVVNKILKKSRTGFNMKQMILNFTNKLGQHYDFIMPFKICFKITSIRP
jgi:hypothetical protein